MKVDLRIRMPVVPGRPFPGASERLFRGVPGRLFPGASERFFHRAPGPLLLHSIDAHAVGQIRRARVPASLAAVALCAGLTATAPTPARAIQDGRGWPSSGEASPESADSAGLAPPAPGAGSDAKPSRLRLTAKDLNALEHRLNTLRERTLTLRAERAHLEDELRRLGDFHGSLDDAETGPASPALDASRRRQEVEESARALQERLGTLEEEERSLGKAQVEIEKLLRELRPKPPPNAISTRRLMGPAARARAG